MRTSEDTRDGQTMVRRQPATGISTPGGAVLLTRDQLRARVRDELAGLDLVGELLADRRRAAATRTRLGPGPLTDRLCLALAERVSEAVLTADASWESTGRLRQIRRPAVNADRIV